MKQTSATVLFLATALVTILNRFGTVSPARANESAAAKPADAAGSADSIPVSSIPTSSDKATAAIAPLPAESSLSATKAQPTQGAMNTAIQSSAPASTTPLPFFLQIKTQVPKPSFMEELWRLQLESQNGTLPLAGSAESASAQSNVQIQQNAQTSVNILRKPNLPPTSTGLLAPHSQFGYDGLGDGGSMYGGQLILPATRLAPINLEIAQ